MRITRDVVSDLWPLVVSGECSPDTRAVVEAFLRDDPDFARRLQAAGELPAAPVTMAPDAEVRALTRTRDLLNGGRWLRGLRLVALALTGLAIARVVQTTSWNDSTRELVARAIVAALAWILYVTLLHRQRVRVLG